MKRTFQVISEIKASSNFLFLAANWTKEETNLLWDLCGEFSLRFPIIYDRFNYEMKKLNGNHQGKTVEEIKERYFEINSKLTGDKFVYDKAGDQKRRMVLESYHARSLEQSLEEAFVVDYLSKLQQNGELERRLAERIETIKMLAGEQFTAGWPTLPELMKIASGKGVARLSDKSRNKKKKKKKPSSSNSGVQNTTEPSTKPTASVTSKPVAPPTKKVKTSSPLSQSGNFYLQSSQIHPLRVGSARAVEKILSDLNLPFKPDLPTAEVVKKFDQVRTAIIKLIDARKAAGLPPSKSLESSQSSINL
jgi:DNA methyltransferase 1-associated protein 1